MNQEQARELLIKYQLGNCTPEEKALVDHWYFDEAAKQPIPESPHDPLQEEQLIWNHILEELPVERKLPYLIKWPIITVAAAILIFLSVGLYLELNKRVAQNQLAHNHYHKDDIVPGSNKAILTLANGKQIILTGAINGTLAMQSRTEIKKKADGEIVYTVDKSKTGNSKLEVQYNTMTTPRGGQYWVTLPDGSKVLLNSASSLTYPTAFIGNERKVELTGEAYFEVAHDPVKPFKVNSNGQTVEVLGTHFNINAYSDEASIKTTLLEGAVRISKGGHMAMLKPGQQAQIAANVANSKINVTNVDTEDAIAWKNGLFIFEGDNIQHIMRMVSRWYDVNVEYNGNVPDDIFGGSTSRFSDVSQVLNVLQLTGKVHFKIEGRKIIVSK